MHASNLNKRCRLLPPSRGLYLPRTARFGCRLLRGVRRYFRRHVLRARAASGRKLDSRLLSRRRGRGNAMWAGIRGVEVERHKIDVKLAK